MEAHLLDSLTRSERIVLLTLLRERDQKAVAKSLGLSPETVKTHLRNARDKCDAASSFTLAKALADHDGSHPFLGMPSDGGEDEPRTRAKRPEPRRHEPSEAIVEEAREARTPFDFVAADPVSSSRQAYRVNGSDSGFIRILRIGAVIVFLVAAILLAFPLSESFQRLADRVDPSTH